MSDTREQSPEVPTQPLEEGEIVEETSTTVEETPTTVEETSTTVEKDVASEEPKEPDEEPVEEKPKPARKRKGPAEETAKQKPKKPRTEAQIRALEKANRARAEKKVERSIASYMEGNFGAIMDHVERRMNEYFERREKAAKKSAASQDPVPQPSAAPQPTEEYADGYYDDDGEYVDYPYDSTYTTTPENKYTVPPPQAPRQQRRIRPYPQPQVSAEFLRQRQLANRIRGLPANYGGEGLY